MRVSTSWIQQQSVGSMMERQSDLSDLNTQLSTGKRINQPSDDPVGAARALDMSHLIADAAQYQRNITTANARLGLEEQTLANSGNVLQRVRTLLLQAANGSQTDGSRSDIAAELAQLRGQLLGQANSTDGQGEYIFAGNRTGTQPFVSGDSVSYLGDDGQRMVAAGPGLQVATGDAGSPITNKRSFDTKVRVDDGQTIVLAGMIRNFERKKSADADSKYKRTVNTTGTGGVRAKTFVAKLRLDAIEHLDHQINEWLEQHPTYEIKYATTVVGELTGKIKEPALFMTVFI